MQDHADAERRFRRQIHLRSSHINLSVARQRIGRQNFRNQFMQWRRAPIALNEQRVGAAERLDAWDKALREGCYRLAVTSGLRRDAGDHGQHVLAAVIELGQQELLMLFAALALADIAKEADENQFPIVRYRRYGELNWKLLSAFSKRRYFDALSHDRLHAGLKVTAQPAM